MKTELLDQNILIRPYRAEDLDALYEAARESIREVSTWLPWCHADYSKEESSAYILSRDEAWSNGSEYSFGIFDARTGAFLGGVGLNQINRMHMMANLGYWVRSSSTKRGVASKATRLVARFGLEELGLQRIEIVVAVDNWASQRVAEKVGATREGILRKRLLIHGRPQDALMYSLVAEDLDALRMPQEG